DVGLPGGDRPTVGRARPTFALENPGRLLRSRGDARAHLGLFGRDIDAQVRLSAHRARGRADGGNRHMSQRSAHPLLDAQLSRQVLGSGTRWVGFRPASAIAATGLGPRQMVVMSARALRYRSRGTCFSTAARRWRKPTPVKKIMTSISPVMSRLAKSTASRLCSIATSRMLGLTNGRPPNFSISRAISAALRLSSAATRRLAKVGCWAVIVKRAKVRGEG